METYGTSAEALERLPADRRLLEELSARGLITPAAYQHALAFLHPPRNWGLWVSRLLLLTGVGLVLAGIIYFFAFNWAKLPWAAKFGLIEVAMLACVAAACWYGTERLAGKALLLGAFTLLGVFLAVFGQIYQTGADSYTLFMMWALLTAGWVILADFALLWAAWLIVTTAFLWFWWDQAVLADLDAQLFIASIVAALFLFFLALREIVVLKGAAWPAERWTRLVLIIAALSFMFDPTVSWIYRPSTATSAATFGTLFACLTHIGLFVIYRYILPDLLALTVVILSGCIIMVVAAFWLFRAMFVSPLSSHSAEIFGFLMSGIFTVALFALAIAALRAIATTMEARNVR